MRDDMLQHVPSLSNMVRMTMNLGIHLAIARLSCNKYLHRICANTQAEIRIGQSFIDRQYRDPVFIAKPHFPVFEANIDRDADAAEKALSVHLHDAYAKAHTYLVDDEITSISRPSSP